MGKLVSGIVGGIGSIFTGGEKGRRYERAGRKGEAAIAAGQDYVRNESGLTDYATTGGAARDAIAGALGVGGNPEAASTGYTNFLNSAGYRANLEGGVDAINASAAARGKLNAGSTGKSLVRFGSDLGKNYFNQYLGQLGMLSGQGLNASTNLASSATGAAGATAGTLYNAETGSAEARDAGYNNAFQGFGYAAGADTPFTPGGWG